MEDKKELIVFVLYLNVKGLKPSEEAECVASNSSIFRNIFKDVEEKTNYLVKLLIFTTIKEETRLECVFPKNQEEIDLDALLNEEPKTLTLGEANEYIENNISKEKIYSVAQRTIERIIEKPL